MQLCKLNMRRTGTRSSVIMPVLLWMRIWDVDEVVFLPQQSVLTSVSDKFCSGSDVWQLTTTSLRPPRVSSWSICFVRHLRVEFWTVWWLWLFQFHPWLSKYLQKADHLLQERITMWGELRLFRQASYLVITETVSTFQSNNFRKIKTGLYLDKLSFNH